MLQVKQHKNGNLEAFIKFLQIDLQEMMDQIQLVKIWASIAEEDI